MIQNLSKSIIGIFLKNGVIENEEIDFYDYGVQLLISTLLGFVLILTISVLFGELWLGVLYLFCVVPARMITGSYHADTYFACNPFFSAAFFLVLVFYLLLRNQDVLWPVLPFNIVSVTITLTCAPVPNKNKPLTVEKARRFRRYSIMLVSFFMVMTTVLAFLGFSIGMYISLTCFAVAIMMVMGVVKERRGNV